MQLQSKQTLVERENRIKDGGNARFSRFYLAFPPIVRPWVPSFLNISDKICLPLTTKSKEGLLGLAFDPNYKENGYFYVHYIFF